MKSLTLALILLGLIVVSFSALQIRRSRIDHASQDFRFDYTADHWFGRRSPSQPARIHASANTVSPDRTVAGLVSATEDRAQVDARRKLDEIVASWLMPQVPLSWHAPTELVDAMIQGVQITPDEKTYGVVYTAVLDVDFTAEHRERLLAAYRRDVVEERTFKLAAAFIFMITCLVATSGYIRADEATRGYYTNQLRLAAAAGVGAAGVAIYRLLI